MQENKRYSKTWSGDKRYTIGHILHNIAAYCCHVLNSTPPNFSIVYLYNSVNFIATDGVTRSVLEPDRIRLRIARPCQLLHSIRLLLHANNRVEFLEVFDEVWVEHKYRRAYIHNKQYEEIQEKGEEIANGNQISICNIDQPTCHLKYHIHHSIEVSGWLWESDQAVYVLGFRYRWILCLVLRIARLLSYDVYHEEEASHRV